MPQPTNTTPLVDAHPLAHNFHYDAKAHFGAKGDNTTDDTTALQAGLTAIASNSGGTLRIPKGRYIISSPLTITLNSARNTNIVGDGFHTSVLVWKAGVADPGATSGMIKITQGGLGGGPDEGTRIHGIGFVGTALASNGIYIVDMIRGVISQCGFWDFAAGTNGACIYFDTPVSFGNLENTVEQCFFYGGLNYGIYQTGTANGTRILYNEFGWTGPGSLRLSQPYGLVQGNYFEGLTVDSKYSIETGAYCRIMHNNFEDLTSGRPHGRSIYVRSGEGAIEIGGNTFGLATASSTDYGIELAGTNSGVSIHDNYWASNHSVSNVLLGNTACSNIFVEREMNGTGGSSGYISGGNWYNTMRSFTGNEQPFGYWRLGINTGVTAPAADLDVNGQVFTNGVSTKVKAGVPNDGDFATGIEDGMLAVDSTNNKIYVRVGGTWKSVTVT